MQRLIVLSKSVKTIGEQLKTGLKLLGNWQQVKHLPNSGGVYFFVSILAFILTY
jgi:hypothetical protein